MVVVGRGEVVVDAQFDRDSVGRVGRQIERSFSRIGQTAGNNFVRQFNISLGRTGVIIGATTALLAPLSSAFSGLAGGATALGGALFNTVASAASLTGVLGSLTQVSLAGHLAFDKFSKAILATTPEQLEKAMRNMGPAASALVLQFRDLRDEYLKLANAVQESVFAGLSDDVDRLAKIFFPLLEKHLVITGKLYNDLLKDITGFAESESVISRIGIAMEGNNRIFAEFKKAVVPALEGTLNLFIALQPAAARLGESVTGLARRFRDWTNEAGNAERIDAFMKRAQETAGRLFNVFGNLGGALGAVFGAAAPATERFLIALQEVTQKFEDFAKSANGQNAIAEWADAGVTAMLELGTVIGKFGQVFAIFSDPALFLAILHVFEEMADLFIRMGPAIEVLVSALARIIDAAAPILGPILAISAATLALGVTFGTLSAVLAPITGLLAKMGISFGFLAGPLGLILVPLGLLIGLMGSGVLSGDTLTTGITNIANTFATAVPAIVSAVTTAIPIVITAILNAVPAILNALVAAIPALVQGGVALVTGLVNGLVAALPLLVTTASTLITVLIEALTSALPVIIQGAVTLFTGLVEGLTTALPLVLAAIVAAIPQIVAALVAAIPVLIQGALTLFLGIIQALTTAIPLILTAITTALPQIIGAIVTAIPLLVTGLITALTVAIPQLIIALGEAIPLIITALLEAIPLIIEGAIQLFLGIIDGLTIALPQIVDALIEILPVLVEALVGMIPELLNAAVQLFLSLVIAIGKALPQILVALGKLIIVIVKELVKLPAEILAAVGPLLLKAGGKMIEFIGDGIAATAKGLAGLLKRELNTAFGLPIKLKGVTVVPAFAKGVTNFSGGLALVGEQGPELVNLPRGSDVIPNNQTERMIGSPNSASGSAASMGSTNIFNITTTGPLGAGLVQELDWWVRFGSPNGAVTSG